MKRNISIRVILIAVMSIVAVQGAIASDKEGDEVEYATGTDALPDSLIDAADHKVTLNEVVVEGATMINKADRKLMIPTAEQVKLSKNGVELLKNIQIPAIVINPIDNSIKLAGNGKLDLRINGRPAQVNDVKAIDPRYVVRVEYHDNPSLRYGDVEAVVDFIVKQPTSGGSLGIDISQALNKGWGNYNVNAKVNYKKSEFSMWNYFGPRFGLKQWRDNEECYTMPDGSKLSRVETGIPASLKVFQDWGNIGYNYSDPDKTLFSAQLRLGFNIAPNDDFTGVLTSSDTKNTINVSDMNDDNYFNPQLDLYYQRNLGKGQLIMANVVGSYTNSRYNRHYSETLRDADSRADLGSIIDMENNVKGKQYSFIGEVDYEKTWNKSRLTAGAKHTQSWSNSTYETSNIESKMRQGESYIFGEWWQRLSDKVDVTAGVGGSRLFSNVIDGGETSSWSFRPKVNVRYVINNKSTLRFGLTSYNNAPSLDNLNNVEQKVDNYQIKVGNADIKSFTTYKLNLQYEYNKGIFYGKLMTDFWAAKNPVMGEKCWRGDNIISTVNNQKSYQELKFEFQTRVNVVKDWLTVSGSMGWHRYWMNGNNYSHRFNNFFHNGNISVTHWNVALSGFWMTNYNMFWGETMTGGENVHGIGARYNYKDMSFGVMVLDPFVNNYNVPTEDRNQYASYNRKRHINIAEQLVCVTFSWNISWGRKHESQQKRLDNKADSGAVKAAGK